MVPFCGVWLMACAMLEAEAGLAAAEGFVLVREIVAP